MRCLAFAETLNWAGWSSVFATAEGSREVVPSREQTKVDFVSAESGNDDPRVTLAVIDHYDLDARFERALSRAGCRRIVFDDLADRRHDCHILVDPTPGRSEADYRDLVSPECRLLLGPQHAIIRRQWTALRAATLMRLVTGPTVNRVIVAMGATDPQDATSRILAALSRSGLDAAVDIVLGQGAPHLGRVREILGPRMRLHVNPEDFPALAAQADLAIGAPGTSSFERAVLGLPSLLIQIADNQRFVAAAFAESGAAEIVPAELLNDSEALGRRIRGLAEDSRRRADMANKAATLTDGRGALRLLVAIAGTRSAKRARSIRLRLAEPTDGRWLLALQCQDATRRFARNPTKPTAEEHAAWFGRTLLAGDRLLTIIEADEQPAGMVRLDRSDGESASFEISIAIDTARHGEGIGAAALSLVRSMMPAAELIAHVKPENESSLRLFERAGYRPIGGDRYRSSLL
jgi:UDP-2,4-diacetamido-2,4,6-trideoxy-beta-L-altropyranose hydrolase